MRGGRVCPRDQAMGDSGASRSRPQSFHGSRGCDNLPYHMLEGRVRSPTQTWGLGARHPLLFIYL